MAAAHEECDIFASAYDTITNKVSKYMFLETRKLMDSSSLSYLHDLPAKFPEDLKNGPHTTIILGYTFPNITEPTLFCNYETKYHYHKEYIISKSTNISKYKEAILLLFNLV